MRKMEDIAIRASREAGKVLIKNLGEITRVTTKQRGELVTNVDRAAERKILDIVRESYPDHAFLAEETGKIEGEADYKWIIDPLDGTHNYIRGLDMFGVSIAVEYKEDVVLGVIYMPIREELYVARKGEGAYLNGEKMEVSRNELDEATMIYDSDICHGKGKPRVLENLTKLAECVFDVRMLGSSARALTHVAEGKIDFAIDYYDKPWDFAAGAFIVEEAGGKVSDIHGKRWSPWGEGYIASNEVLHERIVKLMVGKED